MADNINDGRMLTPGKTLPQPADITPFFRHYQQAAAAAEVLAFGSNIGTFHTCPRFGQSNRRSAKGIINRNKKTLLGLRLDDDPLVHQHILLQRSFEIITKRTIGIFCFQPPIIGLHQDALADMMMAHLLPDGNDTAAGFMAGNGCLACGPIGRYFRQNAEINPFHDVAFAGMPVKLFKQFQIGKTQSYRFDTSDNLIGSGRIYALGRIDPQLIGTGQFQGGLKFW